MGNLNCGQITQDLCNENWVQLKLQTKKEIWWSQTLNTAKLTYGINIVLSDVKKLYVVTNVAEACYRGRIILRFTSFKC